VKKQKTQQKIKKKQTIYEYSSQKVLFVATNSSISVLHHVIQCINVSTVTASNGTNSCHDEPTSDYV
jgi:hypothetical protein